MRSRAWLWTLAAVITLGSAVYQRMTGPTYPVRGSVTLGGQQIGLRLTRTHPGAGDQPVTLTVPDSGVAGEVRWRRFPTGDPWTTVPLVRNGDLLEAALPHQPTAGKLEYQVRLTSAPRFRNAPPSPDFAMTSRKRS
jgi:hypothetical protein